MRGARRRSPARTSAGGRISTAPTPCGEPACGRRRGRGHLDVVLAGAQPAVDGQRIQGAHRGVRRAHQHHQDAAARGFQAHRDAAAGFVDEAGLRGGDLPAGGADQAVGVVEHALAAVHFDAVMALAGGGRDLRVDGSRLQDLGHVARRRMVVRRQPGRLLDHRVLQAQRRDLQGHRLQEGRAAAGIGAGQRRGGMVVGGHQRQGEGVLARHHRAHGHPRARELQAVEVVPLDADRLRGRQVRVQHDHGGHQLGHRGDRRRRGRVLLQQHLSGGLVEHQRMRRAQRHGAPGGGTGSQKQGDEDVLQHGHSGGVQRGWRGAPAAARRTCSKSDAASCEYTSLQRFRSATLLLHKIVHPVTSAVRHAQPALRRADICTCAAEA